MKEKKREGTPGGGNGDSIFNSLPGMPPNTMVSVSSGPYCEDLPVAGSSVGEVRRKFSDRFDIDDGSQAVVNGVNVKDDVVLQPGEALQFIKHAGEKGAAKVMIENEQANYRNPEGEVHSIPITHLAERMGPPMSTGRCVLPFGIRSVISQGNLTVWVWEKPPHIARLSWIRENSPSPYGPGTTYRNVRIGLPYLIILAVFARDSNGMPTLLCKDECFFRTEPLKSLDDKLFYPGLLNCSKFPGGRKSRAPLSWICTQYLKPTPKMHSKDPSDRFQAGFEAVRYCLLETSFNMSSEHHEGNSWYGESKKIDARISTIERWEKETVKDPLFALDVPWIDTDHAVGQVADRMFGLHGSSASKVSTADDVARLIAQG